MNIKDLDFEKMTRAEIESINNELHNKSELLRLEAERIVPELHKINDNMLLRMIVSIMLIMVTTFLFK